MDATTTRFARNGPVRIAWEDLGGAGGEPLLLVMGLGTSRFWWPRPFVEEFLSRGFHVLAYDQRDAGESSRVPQQPRGNPFAALFRPQQAAYSAEDQVVDALAVLDAAGWESAHVFGHSMGGLVAQRIALRHPARVRSLTVSGAVPSDAKGLGVLRHLRPGVPARMARLRPSDGPDADAEFALSVARLLASPGFGFDEQDEAQVRAFVAAESARGVVSFRDPQAQSRQIGAKWHGGPLAEMRVPTLVLHGEADQILHVSAARATAAAVPGARLVTFPGAGHLIPRQLYARYAAETAAHALATASGRD